MHTDTVEFTKVAVAIWQLQNDHFEQGEDA